MAWFPTISTAREAGEAIYAARSGERPEPLIFPTVVSGGRRINWTKVPPRGPIVSTVREAKGRRPLVPFTRPRLPEENGPFQGKPYRFTERRVDHHLPRVFIVDDDASVRKALGRLVRSAGYEVEIFSGAAEYLARSA